MKPVRKFIAMVACGSLLALAVFVGSCGLPAEARDRCTVPADDIRDVMIRVYGLKREGEVKPLPGCPGYDDFDPGYLNVTLNNRRLRIPRKLIAYRRNIADGPASRAFLRINLPEFQKELGRQSKSHRVSITIVRLGNDSACGTGLPWQRYNYLSHVHYYDPMRACESSEPISKDINILTSGVGELKYFVTTMKERMYFSGDADAPSEFLLCSGGICQSSVYVGGNINIKYRFENIDALIGNLPEIKDFVIRRVDEMTE